MCQQCLSTSPASNQDQEISLLHPLPGTLLARSCQKECARAPRGSSHLCSAQNPPAMGCVHMHARVRVCTCVHTLWSVAVFVRWNESVRGSAVTFAGPWGSTPHPHFVGPWKKWLIEMPEMQRAGTRKKDARDSAGVRSTRQLMQLSRRSTVLVTACGVGSGSRGVQGVCSRDLSVPRPQGPVSAQSHLLCKAPHLQSGSHAP